MSDSRLWLFVHLRDPLRAELIRTDAQPGFLQEAYDAPRSDFHGHYDWLRKVEDRIVGVRYFPLYEDEDPAHGRLMSEVRAVCDTLPSAELVGDVVSVRFTPEGEVVEARSCDQELAESGAFRGEAGGDLTLYFEVDLWFDGAFVLA